MKDMFYMLIILFTLASCGMHEHKYEVCNCCQKTYTNIDSAMKCILQTRDNSTTADERLFLIAFVSKDVEANQKLGWNIIKDQDVVNIAKQNYLLITVDVNNIQIPKNQRVSELKEIIKKHKEEFFFVITNQALYPFADWTISEKKEIIVGRLRIGNGP